MPYSNTPKRKALFFEKLENKAVKCGLCNHYCTIQNDKFGICGVRKNLNGSLYSNNWGLAPSIAIDPIEKKPFNNFKPATKVLSFGSPGCNFHCLNCQNWNLSQINEFQGSTKLVTPELMADIAQQYNVDGLAYTYSEPTVFFEYLYDIIHAIRERKQLEHLFNVYVSNGYFTDKVLDLIISENLLQAIRIDLKFMSDEKYKRICHGSLAPVLENIERIYKAGIHLEIINLVINDENDSNHDFEKISSYIAKISPEIPLHFSRFYPQYLMKDSSPTHIDRLVKAKHIAQGSGLKYIYLGNVDLPNANDTFCPKCKAKIIDRENYFIKNVNLKKINDIESACVFCNEKINVRL